MQTGKRNWLAQAIEVEKREMLPLNFTMSYWVAPLYVLVSFLLIAGFGILLAMDEAKYFLPAMVLMGIFIVMSIALLASVPFVRKRAIEAEMQRYCFDTTNVVVERKLNVDGKHLCFNKDGVKIDDNVFDYSDLCCRIVTDNYCKRINVSLSICPPADEEGVLLPLTCYTLKLLECLPIPLENPELLEYILQHKAEAFRQIYDRGWVKLPS